MDQNCINLIHTEVSTPKRHFIRSDGALYAIVLICVFGIIFLGNRVGNSLGISQGMLQLILYAILLVLAYLLYRFRLTAFRYTITDENLYIDKVTGSKEKNLFTLPLCDIAIVAPSPDVKAPRTYCGKRNAALLITCSQKYYLLSATPTFKEKLIEHTTKVA